MNQGAVFDPTGQYRYRLWREWQADAPRIGFIMLNPSTASVSQDDPTIRRCLGFARAWGYGSLDVVNLFAYRSTQPERLYQVADPVGVENDRYLFDLSCSVECLLLAWGNRGSWQGRDQHVLALLQAGTSLYCLGVTQVGQPRHPLYIKSNTLPMRFPGSTLPSSSDISERSELTRWK